MNNPKFQIPPIVAEKYDQLFDLCQNRSKNGNLNPKDVATFLGKSQQWLLTATYSGAVPFAFGTNKMVARGTSCIHVLPFYAFCTQGILFRPVADRDNIEHIAGYDL